MKRSLILFSGLLPGLAAATSTGMLLAGVGNIPDDFKSYFYQSEMPVQVLLNDRVLFDASMRMHPDGSMSLVSILSTSDDVSDEVRKRWEAQLRKGVASGKCDKSCSNGLISADYSLNNSVLRLLTSHYEKERVASDYINLPDSFPTGVIVNNDFSASQSSSSDKRWSLYSDITASLGGWSHTMAFQASHVSGNYGYDTTDLYDLYSQKEHAGHFFRLGFFTPDNDSGNVQTSSFGYDSVIGAMWGTSDILLNNSESVSAWPVYVNGRNQAIAEVYRDGRLIHTQQLQEGIQAIDTRRLPGGSYDITIRVIENGQVVDTQTAQIYKPNSWRNTSRHWRGNLWAGQRRDISSRQIREPQDQKMAVGGSLDVLAWSGGIFGASTTVLENNDYWLRFRGDITLTTADSLFLQHTRTSEGLSASQGTNIRYYRNLTAGTSGSLYWRNTQSEYDAAWYNIKNKTNTWGASLSTRLSSATTLTASTEYQDSQWRKGLGSDVSLATRYNWRKRDTDVRISAYDRPGYRDNGRDQGAAINLTVALFPADSRHYVSAAAGINNGHGYTNAGYQWRPEAESMINWMGATVSQSRNVTTLSANTGFDTPYINGDGYVQRTSGNGDTSAGLNLNQSLVWGGGKLAATNYLYGQKTAIIVDVEDEEGAEVVASGRRAETQLKRGRNVIPVDLWQRDSVQFTSADSSANVTPSGMTVQMNRGSVGYVKVRSVKTRTLIAVLRDTSGNILPNSVVTVNEAKGYVGDDGILTMNIAAKDRQLTVTDKHHNRELSCTIPEAQESEGQVQFHDNMICR